LRRDGDVAPGNYVMKLIREADTSVNRGVSFATEP
jgi:hypothetical protein